MSATSKMKSPDWLMSWASQTRKKEGFRRTREKLGPGPGVRGMAPSPSTRSTWDGVKMRYVMFVWPDAFARVSGLHHGCLRLASGTRQENSGGPGGALGSQGQMLASVSSPDEFSPSPSPSLLGWLRTAALTVVQWGLRMLRQLNHHHPVQQISLPPKSRVLTFDKRRWVT